MISSPYAEQMNDTMDGSPVRWRGLWRTAGRLLAIGVVALAGCGATPSVDDPTVATAQAANREAVVDAMQAELDRSVERLRFRDYAPPYFIGYTVRDIVRESVVGKYGAIADDDVARTRTAYVEVRVGDYDFDNFANVDGESFRLSEYTADRTVPLEPDLTAIRGTLWLITDEVYKKAVSDFLTKKGGAVYATDEKIAVPSFSREEPQRHRGPTRQLEFDRARWREIVKSVSAEMLEEPQLLDSAMTVDATKIVRYITNSEGGNIVDESTIYSIQIEAWARADDGMMLENGRSFYARDANELPGEDEIRAEAKEMVEQLVALRNAPTIDPYTGPAILLPEASGVLFHEAVGHRLEGERQRSDEEGRTFKGRVGKVVIPRFLSVVDDPTRAEWDETQLNGHYAFDDEGVAAKPAVLIEDGVLRGYLKSRTPIEGSLKSNGHGRAQGLQKPIARMANTIVSASAEKSVPYDELKRMLIEEVKRQKKPFGLIIKDITGGSTNTSGYGYQAFKGSPRLLYKVDPETGDETLVRGAELVGTPLTSIGKIVGASTETGVFNGYCGAESGYVPVSTIAPALLTTEIELQRTQQSNERPPILPPPWNERGGEG